jgi:hypothetical protein
LFAGLLDPIHADRGDDARTNIGAAPDAATALKFNTNPKVDKLHV